MQKLLIRFSGECGYVLELTCKQQELAKTAGVTQGDVYRALLRLVAMGALVKNGRGRYKVHPSLMWRGELTARDAAEVKTHPFTVVEGGKAETEKSP
jgi:hypothetical protein